MAGFLTGALFDGYVALREMTGSLADATPSDLATVTLPPPMPLTTTEKSLASSSSPKSSSTSTL